MKREFRIASTADAQAVTALVNRAYRPPLHEQGWTHEADLVAGDRISASQVCELLRPQSAVLLLLLDQTLVSCTHVETNQGSAHISMLAVDPTYQAQGIGKQILAHAERYAVEIFQANSYQMRVLDCRPELIAFYVRRGYKRTGRTEDFPVSAAVGQPKSYRLRFEQLVKSATTANYGC